MIARRRFVLLALLAAMPHAASGAVQSAPPTGPAASDASTSLSRSAASQDRSARVTVPVMINGSGPYSFVIDTAADRTVVSRELATLLALPPGPPAVLHDTAGVQQVQTAVIGRLSVGGREILAIDAPMLPVSGLGADGMLGIDSLSGQTIVLDPRGRIFQSGPSAGDAVEEPAGFGSETIVVQGRRRFGQLILVDAESHGEPIYVVLDSGAQNTIGNAALRALIAEDRRGKGRPVLDQVISVTGRETPAEIDLISSIRLGEITIGHVPIAFADLHTFAHLGLANAPAMLLGMDVLREFRSISVDFRRHRAVFVTR
jgi:hypothetical protein